MKQHSKFSVYQLVLTGALTALLEAVKTALAVIPGAEAVTLLIIVYTQVLGWKMSLLIVFLFDGIETILYGFGLWTADYLYIWPFLVLLAHLIRNEPGKIPPALLAGFFGLGFGAMCVPVTIAALGKSAALAWWISGLWTDIVHGISNFLITFLLKEPLTKGLAKVNRYQR
ncbi:MAG: hypothetical protein ACI4WR_10255 [Bulleidia sp.]